jgi:hypothetical protein
MNALWNFAANKINPDQINVPTLSADQVVHNTLNAVYFWGGVVCVIVIVVAGYLYVTSAGNAATIKKAKDAIFGAVIGLVLMLMAFAITAFVIGRL